MPRAHGDEGAMEETVLRTRRTLATLVIATVLPTGISAECIAPERDSSLAEIVQHVHDQGVRYVFVGERHGVGPVKRFAVDLANALLDSGLDVGLYVEGFRTDCPPQYESCWSLARTFNNMAFRTLLDESRAPVHPIDSPHGKKQRAASMAAAVAAGTEQVKVVLVGKSHVLYAGDGEAELWAYGGGLKFPDPGDVVESFPQREVLTFGLVTSRDIAAPYALRANGCAVDYVVTTLDTDRYWGTVADGVADDAVTTDTTTARTTDVDEVEAEVEIAEAAVTSSS